MATAPTGQPAILPQSADPLAALRDIHEPAMLDTWPPAPGWWVLAAIALIALIALITWLLRRWHANRYRREASRELAALMSAWEQHGDDQAYLQSVQDLLKRVALTRFPRADVASLTGEAWVQFLDRSTGSHDFSIGEAEALIDGNYRPAAQIDVLKLQAIARQWINRHDPRYMSAHHAGEVSA